VALLPQQLRQLLSWRHRPTFLVSLLGGALDGLGHTAEVLAGDLEVSVRASFDHHYVWLLARFVQSVLIPLGARAPPAPPPQGHCFADGRVLKPWLDTLRVNVAECNPTNNPCFVHHDLNGTLTPPLLAPLAGGVLFIISDADRFSRRKMLTAGTAVVVAALIGLAVVEAQPYGGEQEPPYPIPLAALTFTLSAIAAVRWLCFTTRWHIRESYFGAFNTGPHFL
jgi:hypothetical protein